MYERILCALDGSASAEKALPYAREIARRFGSTLLLFGAVEADSYEPALSREIISNYLESVADRVRANGFPVEVIVREGSPADTILRYAKENSIDLIVLTAHGRSGRVGSVYGRVAGRIIRDAGAPVLLVRESNDSSLSPKIHINH